MKCTDEVTSGSMIYIPSFMTIGLKGCSVSATDGSMPLRWPWVT
jgi:hypothetical protein